MEKIISPSILSADFADIKGAIKNLEASGADMIHCDVMDGAFVKNITFGMKMIHDINNITSLPLDVHLMIFRPEKYIKEFIKCGADILTIHVDATDNVEECLEEIRENGAKSGLAVSPDIKTYSMKQYVHLVDLMLIMSVYPGFGGQKFIKNSIKKVSEANELRAEAKHPIKIEIDGGINFDNAKQVWDSGVDILVAGSAIFNTSDMKGAIQLLRNS